MIIAFGVFWWYYPNLIKQCNHFHNVPWIKSDFVYIERSRRYGSRLLAPFDNYYWKDCVGPIVIVMATGNKDIWTSYNIESNIDSTSEVGHFEFLITYGIHAFSRISIRPIGIVDFQADFSSKHADVLSLTQIWQIYLSILSCMICDSNVK